MIGKKNELVKAALLIYKHCEKNMCKTCPFLWGDPDDPDEYGCECRLDASCPADWDVDEKMLESEEAAYDDHDVSGLLEE